MLLFEDFGESLSKIMSLLGLRLAWLHRPFGLLTTSKLRLQVYVEHKMKPENLD